MREIREAGGTFPDRRSMGLFDESDVVPIPWNVRLFKISSGIVGGRERLPYRLNLKESAE